MASWHLIRANLSDLTSHDMESCNEFPHGTGTRIEHSNSRPKIDKVRWTTGVDFGRHATKSRPFLYHTYQGLLHTKTRLFNVHLIPNIGTATAQPCSWRNAKNTPPTQASQTDPPPSSPTIPKPSTSTHIGRLMHGSDHTNTPRLSSERG